MASACASGAPAFTSERTWASKSRLAGVSASSLSALSVRSKGRPAANRLASWRVHTTMSVRLNTRACHSTMSPLMAVLVTLTACSLTGISAC